MSLYVTEIMAGDPDGSLRWQDSVTRAEAAKMLVTGMGTGRDEAVSRAVPLFRDVGPDHWALGYLTIASERGLVRGYPDGTCQPDSPVTKGEFAVMIARMWLSLGGKYVSAGESSKFLPGNWATREIEKVPGLGEVLEMGHDLSYLEQNLDRAQAATLLFSILNSAGAIFDLHGSVLRTEEGAMIVRLGGQDRVVGVAGPVVYGETEISLSQVPVGTRVSMVLDGSGRCVLAVVE